MSNEVVLRARCRVFHQLGLQGVRSQIERVSDNQRLRFPSHEFPDGTETGVHAKVGGKNQRLIVRRAGRKAKRRGSELHLAVANHDVAVAAKAFTFLFL